MTAMPPLRPILNDTPANAVDVDWNFQALEDYVATDLIHKDGSVAMEAPLQLSGPAPTQPNHAVPLSYIQSDVLPPGIIWQFGGATAPTGWALCDGTSQSRTDPLYTALFAVIGTTYGSVDASHFNLPNFQNRMPVGKGAAAWSNALGESGGSKDSVVPVHNHTATANSHTHTAPAHTHTINHDHGAATTGNESVGHVHGTVGATGTYYGHNNAGGFAHGGTGPNNWIDLSALTTGNISANHTHSLNLPSYSGPSGSSGAAATDAATPTITVANNGVAVADTNLPPYITVNFIIRL